MHLSSCSETNYQQKLHWSQLPPVPDSTGFAGCFAGVSGDVLIVAGGSNFPNGTRPWSGGVKYWNDKIWALDKDGDQWKEIGRLPHPAGYGISLSWKNGILFIGGADQHQHYNDAYFVTYENDSLHWETLPPLPSPLANSCGAIIDDVVYVAGGLASPSSRFTENNFWSLDLKQSPADRTWKNLPAWPGSSRMLAVAGVINNEFYLVSGTSLTVPEGDTAAHRKYLTDAFVFNPQKGWRQIKDLPFATVAAPSPAYTTSAQQLLIFGGDDGSRAEQNLVLKDKHPGFRTEILRYDTSHNEWTIAGHVLTDRQPDPENNPNASTWAPVTTPLVLWKGNIVLPQGEVRPGVRTNRLLTATAE